MFEGVSKALQYVIIKMGFYSISKSDYHHIIVHQDHQGAVVIVIIW